MPLVFSRRCVGALVLAGFTTLGCSRTEVVSVDGSSTVYLLSAAVAEKFNEVRPDVNVVVGLSGTGGGMKKFSAGEIDLCNASRPIEPNEAQECQAHGIEFLELKVAYDGLTVVANPANDWCDELTVEQLRTIWRKEAEEVVMTWHDVNPDWPEEPLKLYGPGHDSGTFDYFTEVINGEKANCRSDYSPSENDNALVMGVAGDKGALGYFGYGYYVENKDKLKLLKIDGGKGPVAPSPDTVRDGAYAPLSRPLLLYVRKSSLERTGVREFVKFYLDSAASLAGQVHYVATDDEDAQASRQAFEAATK